MSPALRAMLVRFVATRDVAALDPVLRMRFSEFDATDGVCRSDDGSARSALLTAKSAIEAGK